MESNEESIAGADHIHILLAGRLILLLTQADSGRISHMHISYVACMRNTDCSRISHICAMLTVAENAENADCDPLTPSPTGVTCRLDRNCNIFRRRFIMHASTHQHVVIPPDRLVFNGMLLVYARWQTFNNGRSFWTHEIGYGVTGSGHPLVACVAVLFGREADAMDA